MPIYQMERLLPGVQGRGDEYQINYKLDRGVILEIIALDGGKNASVYGDVDMKGDSATHFINKSSEGKFIIKRQVVMRISPSKR